jgi:SAM-dependent methyltransferase
VSDPDISRTGEPPEFEFLCVDSFIVDVASACAISSALELGIIDGLVRQPCAPVALAERSRLDRRAFQLLVGMLGAAGVVEVGDGSIRLTSAFTKALRFRDLLVAKLNFARLVAPDFLDLFPALLADPRRFFEQARLFELFSYQRCFELTAENLAATERWVGITTALTRYEAQACLKYHDFSAYSSILDVGGNSGEFVLRICRSYPDLRATVHDLPVVCEIGRRHLSLEPEAARISFSPAGRSADTLPAGFDLVMFKSMLHDWPDADMANFVDRAYRALKPGGQLMIFERSLFDSGDRQIPYSLIPIMMFFRSYRAPEQYRQTLSAARFSDIRLQTIMLDMPWMLMTARK